MRNYKFFEDIKRQNICRLAGNLDSGNGEEVMKLLSELNKEGTTIIMVTHSPSGAEYAHRIIQLFDGHIVTENIKKIL